ncbi:S1C family serine protease [Microvirga massiliensis]|uniref:S1C family serine protease n=1 Tax=Microvirga massiliensis TaxID=1033741 RepID=UPI00062BC752|nr:S1C family serine protease [Microvirga massiliensis]
MSDPASSIHLQDISAALGSVVASVSSSIVAVHSHRSRSSGFVWRAGLIVTADEALADEGDIAAISPGDEPIAAHVIGRDPTTDIALLRLDRSDLPPAPIAAIPAAVGALALIVGAEEGAPTAALGIVSRVAGPWQSLRGGAIDARLELDLAMRGQAEGGLALNAAGQAFGMAVFGPRRRVLVIPGATIERVAAKLEQHGRISRGYLGLGLQQVTLQGEEGVGVMVMSVDLQGPGAAAGLRQGDVLMTWNGEPLRSVSSLLRALGPESVGQTVTLGLRRAGEAREISLTIGERPLR